ncbi:hypothetical protein A9F13_02g02992 [Clavispora lusitaniae]|uniref:Uncharacterized protein n=1 Tax=Clavispora lusitaniae TaxID=36911 RepID=A0AA91Q351_CLALS|nr:hypothetical protein A9F13_02g02992 [Clavispora lusitaniae]
MISGSSPSEDQFSFEPSPPLRVKRHVAPASDWDVNVNKIVTSVITEMNDKKDEDGRRLGDSDVGKADAGSPSVSAAARSFASASSCPSGGGSGSTISTNPCEGLRLGPHTPPLPASPTEPRPVLQASSFFGDPFSQYMEDRMAQFRPTPSQNNIERALNFGHPYQLTGETERGRKTVRQPKTGTSAFVTDPNSSYSFLAYNQTRPGAEMAEMTQMTEMTQVMGLANTAPEPQPLVMEYTPEAIPVLDSKREELESANCWCLV